jgi:L-iditol 2-dehydrogenase
MLAAVLQRPNELMTQEIPTPEPGPGEVLVKVGANTVCGTDVRILRGEKTSGVRLPVVLGHETAGHVAAVGSGVGGYKIGAPVAVAPAIPCRRCWECRHDLENVCANLRIMGYAIDGGMAEYMLVPAEAVAAGCLFVAESDVPPEELALAEPLACVVMGQCWSRVEVDDTVLIMGGGPIGLLHLQIALLSGARNVIVSQPKGPRRDQAERLGATATVDPGNEELAAAVEEHTGGVGADLTIICVGVPGLVNQAVDLSRNGGRVSIFAGMKDKGLAEVSANLIHYKQVVLSGTSNCRRADYETALHLISSGKIDTASMVTHRFALPDVLDAIGTVGSPDAIKAAVVP